MSKVKDIEPLTPAAVHFCNTYGTRFVIEKAKMQGFIRVTSVATGTVLLCGVWMGVIQIDGKKINW